MNQWMQGWRSEIKGASLRDEVLAALTVTLMSVPQGVAYALIAGLPPAMGLYAGAVPAIVGSLLRSSRHVVSGPTNALSLLVGTSVAAQFDDPVVAATTLIDRSEQARPKFDSLGVPYFPMATYEDLGIDPVGLG